MEDALFQRNVTLLIAVEVGLNVINVMERVNRSNNKLCL
jgi:hypothetical protein